MDSSSYHFPAITLETTDNEQVKKLHSEMNEFSCAARIYGCNGENDEKLDPLNVNACIELWDVIHACETLMRRFDQDIVGACAQIVLAKNMARGYYKNRDFEKVAREIDDDGFIDCSVTAEDYVNGRC